MKPCEHETSKTGEENALCELDWLAFRYIAGELDEAELEAFELRLAEEQPARDAVALAVEVVQTVSAAEHLEEIPMVVTAAREASRWRHVAWLAIAAGVAACCASVALMFSGGVSSVEHDASALAAERVPQASPVVANAWLETFDQPILATSQTVASDPLEIEPALLSGDETEVATPDWMAAALAGMSSDMGMDLERGATAPLEN
ncbi:MAG: hypothetical protein RIC55_22100 [Pirellulaceae bacterium]